MDERSRFIKLCIRALEERGLMDEKHKTRLQTELKEIDAQAEHDYLLDLSDRKAKFPHNEHNLLVWFLLGLCDDFDIEKEYAWIQGELPDIDIDYIRDVRDVLQNEWAPEHFGREKVCAIGTYGALGIKSAILDMTRVYGVPKDEIQAITVKMKDKYDDDGTTKNLDWDAALRLYSDFSAYCEKHPKVAKSAKMALERNKSAGVHAGGLIIADRRIDEFVPLEVRKVTKESPNGVICSAWGEGLKAQDLAPVGLVKFDLLVIRNLDQIAYACNLVKQRHPEMQKNGICALPGEHDWSDISYLNDPKSIAMANEADLTCIFQFDSDGIQKLVKRGGVSSFDDLAAYSALYRPGPLNTGMDARYCKRKKGEEPYNLHPVLEKSLGVTYGVMVYQEQVMDILRAVGKIPDMHTEKVRKAISKKKHDQFIKYKEKFIENGQKVLNTNKDFVSNLWDQIESFAEYGFNKSHAYAYTYVSSRLLWLKSHFPIEFYTAVLMVERETEKYKDYKLDANNHGVKVRPVHINKSKSNFSIHEDEVYFGFENIKGIGHESAKKIVEPQPYEGYRDFLMRYGTDAKEVTRLTALGCFDDLESSYDRITLRKFHEFYKDIVKKRRDCGGRFEKRMVDLDDRIRETVLSEIEEDDKQFEALCQFTDEAELLWEERFEGVTREQQYKSKGETKTKTVPFLKILQKIKKDREKSIKGFEDKETESDGNPIDIDNFNPYNVKLEEEEIEMLMDKREIGEEVSYPMAESQFYGFQWIHKLETSPDYSGMTIDKFLGDMEEGNLSMEGTGKIEIVINAVRRRQSKKVKKDGTRVEFWSIDIEDANARQMVINMWSDDHIRFKDVLEKGAMLRMEVRPPSGGFNTLTFKAYPRHKKREIPPRELDYRCWPLSGPEPTEPKEMDLASFQFDASAIEGLESSDD